MKLSKIPKVFIVPAILLTLPAYAVGTLWAFIHIGFNAGMGGVLKIMFAEAKQRRLDEEAEAIAEAIREQLKRDGIEGEMTVHKIPRKDDDED